MAQFKVKIKKESFITLEVTAKDKIDACILAKHKAKNREGWYNDNYNVINITVL